MKPCTDSSCLRPGQLLPESEFYINSGYRLNRCKTCHKRKATDDQRLRRQGLKERNIMKVCNGCHIALPESEFYQSATCVDGLVGDCKLCIAGKRNERNWAAKEQRERYDRLTGTEEYLRRHELRRLEEEQIARELRRSERVDVFVEPLSFAGVVDSFFRSNRRTFSWVVK